MMLTNMVRAMAFCLAAMPLAASAAGTPTGSATGLTAESTIKPVHIGGTNQRAQPRRPGLRVAQAPAQNQYLYGRRRDRNVAPLMSHATPMSQQRAATVRQQILVRQHQIQQQRRMQQFQQWQRTSQAIAERHRRQAALQAWRAQQQQQRYLQQQQWQRMGIKAGEKTTIAGSSAKIVRRGERRRIRRR
jgi:hypothetical protein